MVWLLLAAGVVLCVLVVADVARRGRTNPRLGLRWHYWAVGLGLALLLAAWVLSLATA